MATFGDTTEHSLSGTIEDGLHGLSGASPASDGTINNITAFIEGAGSGTTDIKCAIYDELDDSLFAVTEERSISYTETGAWETFNIIGTPTVESVKSYYLIAFASPTSPDVKLAVTTTAGSFSRVTDFPTTYPTFPDPIVPTFQGNGSASIYCTYTPPSVGTNISINIADTFKDVDSLQINIGDVWKDVVEVQQNIGDAWKTVF